MQLYRWNSKHYRLFKLLIASGCIRTNLCHFRALSTKCRPRVDLIPPPSSFSPTPFEGWGEESQTAYSKVKEVSIRAPVQGIFNPSPAKWRSSIIRRKDMRVSPSSSILSLSLQGSTATLNASSISERVRRKEKILLVLSLDFPGWRSRLIMKKGHLEGIHTVFKKHGESSDADPEL